MHINKPVRPIHLIRRLAIAAATLAFLPLAILAQQTPSGAAAPTPGPSPTASPTSETAEAERVTVTANKREENIQEVASSVSAINDVELDNLHATQLTDYAPYVPGLQ